MNVFVYGTLRPSLSRKAYSIAGVEESEPAMLSGFVMHHLGSFPALIPAGDKDTVTGELINVPNVNIFDRYEGYRPDGTGLYDRKEVEVTTSSGFKTAWVYFMRRLPARCLSAPKVESGDWAHVTRDTD